MKQKFNGEICTTTKTVNNILRVYDQSDGDGFYWYREANEFAEKLGEEYKVSDWKVAGIIAAFSPLKSWELNKVIAEQFLATGKASHTAVMVKKAKDIMESDGQVTTICDILNGNKIVNFFLNIAQPVDLGGVTIDRHAISIAVGKVLPDSKMRMSKNQYEFFVNAYKIAAFKRDVLPNQMQSVTWVKWKEMKKQNN